MNVRATDSSALASDKFGTDKFATATDLFAATAACHEMGPVPFERVLRSPQPSQSSAAQPTPAPLRQDSTPTTRNSNEQDHRNTSQTSAPDDLDGNQSTGPTAEQAETSEGTDIPSDEATAISDATDDEQPADEVADSPQDVVAESLLLAASLPVDQQVAPEPAIESEETAATEIAVDADVVPAAEHAAAGDRPQITLLEKQSETVTQVEDPGNVEVAQATTNDAIATEASQPTTGAALPAEGIGVLPSALQQPAQAGSISKAATNSRSRTARDNEVAKERETDEVAIDHPPTPSTPEEEVSRRVERSQSALLRGLAANDEQPQPTVDPHAASPAAAPIDAAALPAAESSSELPTSPTRTEIAASRTHDPVPNQSQPGQPLTAPQLVSRLPAHALVRGSHSGQSTEQPSATIDTVRILQRVARAFEAAREQGGEIRLRLSPPELGALRVEVTVVEQGLTAKVEAETPEARTILLENLPALRERLAEQGVKLERFDVDLSQRQPGRDQQQPDQTGHGQQSAPTRSARTPAAGQAAESPARPTAPTNLIQDRRLNVVV